MPSPSGILGLATAHENARVLHVAVELGVFGALTKGQRTVAQLSRSLGTDPRATGLLCNALAALGLLQKRPTGFKLTPLSRDFLTPGGPTDLSGFVRFEGQGWPDWERLAQGIRSGQPLRLTHYLQDEPAELEVLLEAMHALAHGRGDARVVARKVPLRGCRTLLDIGTGPGSYALELCRRNRKLRATLFDLQGTLQVTRRMVARAGMEDRVELRAGDYRHDDLGGPYDVALLFNILHGENEETNRELLRRVYRALVPGGLLLIKDHVLNENLTYPADGAVFSLFMLVFTGGRCYSRGEIHRWLRQAGFGYPEEIKPTPPMTSSVLIASRPRTPRNSEA
jgi:SAM-dependent methyltransferase